jgi:hypothetical protein
MKFRVGTTCEYYTKEQARKLEKFGFKFTNVDLPGMKVAGCPMKINSKPVVIEFSTLGELSEFSKQCCVVQSFDGGGLIMRGDAIMIYDGFIE